jgi:hypothetical protein
MSALEMLGMSHIGLYQTMDTVQYIIHKMFNVPDSLLWMGFHVLRIYLIYHCKVRNTLS